MGRNLFEIQVQMFAAILIGMRNEYFNYHCHLFVDLVLSFAFFMYVICDLVRIFGIISHSQNAISTSIGKR